MMADPSSFSSSFSTSSSSPPLVLPCREFSEFKEALEGARKVDDGIIYRLNTSIPTTSFKGEVSAADKCKELYEEVKSVHSARRSAIQHCLTTTSEQIRLLQNKRDKSPDDTEALRTLRNEQTKLRLMRNELTVEDIARDRTIKVFKERCWQSYKPPDL